MAASNALPPLPSTSIAAAVASGSTLAAAPPVPIAVGCLPTAPAFVGEAATTAAASSTGSTFNHLIPTHLLAFWRRAYPELLPVNPQHRRRGGLAIALAHAGDVNRVRSERGRRQRVLDSLLRARPEMLLVTFRVLVAGLVAEVAAIGRKRAVERLVGGRQLRP